MRTSPPYNGFAPGLAVSFAAADDDAPAELNLDLEEQSMRLVLDNRALEPLKLPTPTDDDGYNIRLSFPPYTFLAPEQITARDNIWSARFLPGRGGRQTLCLRISETLSLGSGNYITIKLEGLRPDPRFGPRTLEVAANFKNAELPELGLPVFLTTRLDVTQFRADPSGMPARLRRTGSLAIGNDIAASLAFGTTVKGQYKKQEAELVLINIGETDLLAERDGTLPSPRLTLVKLNRSWAPAGMHTIGALKFITRSDRPDFPPLEVIPRDRTGQVVEAVRGRVWEPGRTVAVRISVPYARRTNAIPFSLVYTNFGPNGDLSGELVLMLPPQEVHLDEATINEGLSIGRKNRRLKIRENYGHLSIEAPLRIENRKPAKPYDPFEHKPVTLEANGAHTSIRPIPVTNGDFVALKEWTLSIGGNKFDEGPAQFRCRQTGEARLTLTEIVLTAPGQPDCALSLDPDTPGQLRLRQLGEDGADTDLGAVATEPGKRGA